MPDTVTNRTHQSVLRQVAALPALPTRELQERWRDLIGTEPPPACNKPFLVKRLAHRLQELAFGGITDTTQKGLDEVLARAGYNALGVQTSVKPVRQHAFRQYVIGTVLRREWGGGTYEVTVVRNGFEYEGKVYRHLSPIAKLITGCHQSGNAFFGVKPTKGKQK
ncbi:MAG TPA: DUF2924 domain-containing protein [Armatimonadota bacterium]